MIEDGAMGAREYCDDDDGYLAWLAAHPEGYVINIARGHYAGDARAHHAGCRTISSQIPRGRGWTRNYVKVCADGLGELERWAQRQVGRPIKSCGTCQPAQHGSH